MCKLSINTPQSDLFKRLIELKEDNRALARRRDHLLDLYAYAEEDIFETLEQDDQSELPIFEGKAHSIMKKIWLCEELQEYKSKDILEIRRLIKTQNYFRKVNEPKS